jgi:hypothetical protein
VFAEWLAAALGASWTPRACPPAALEELVALVRPAAPWSRNLLLPNRGWTVLLNDGPLGTDPGALLWHAPKDLGCRAVRATVLPAHRPYPATILQVHDPSAVDDPLFSRRTISAANDGGRWVFSETGEQFPFEDPTAYRRRLVKDRFTPADARPIPRRVGRAGRREAGDGVGDPRREWVGITAEPVGGEA